MPAQAANRRFGRDLAPFVNKKIVLFIFIILSCENDEPRQKYACGEVSSFCEVWIVCGFNILNPLANKNAGKNNVSENSFLQDFSQEKEVEMVYPIEYYKGEITKYASDYYGFGNSSMEITDLMNISSIIKVNSIIPGQLVFVVCWLNQKGYVYWLYGFDNEQKIARHYYCGDFVSFKDYKKLMEKLPGNIFEYGTILINDFNNDGKMEIASYSFYKNIGNVFCVLGFNESKNELEELCLAPVFINYDNPFPSVEYIEKGFKILEIIDEDPMELQWENYVWEKDIEKYIRQ